MKSKMIALSAVAAAFITILLTVGAYFPMFDLSCLFLCSLALMLPLTKSSYIGAFMAFLAGGLLALFISAFRFQILIPYVIFFGLHPIVNYYEVDKRKNKLLWFIIKDLWFVAACLVTYFFADMFVVANETLKSFIVPIIIICGAAVFFVYDWLMKGFQRSLISIIKRLKI